MFELQPFLVQPIFRTRVWGGTKLGPWVSRDAAASDQFVKKRTAGKVGEAWLLADLPATVLDGRTSVFNPNAGVKSLHDLMCNPPIRRALLGRAAPAGTDASPMFPLLLKVLDAGENLSLQVHPDPKYSTRNPTALIKNEMWFVLQADEGASIYRGIDPAISKQECRERIESNSLLEVMVKTPVRAGDCFWLPAGICHALGAGLLVAEVQTPSDTTFRVWDWGRNDSARPLDIESALECMLLGDEQNLDGLDRPRIRNTVRTESISIEGLVRSEWFDVERWVVAADTPLQHDAIGVPVVWTILAGELSSGQFAKPLTRSATLVLPAHHTGLDGQAGPDGVEILVTTLDDPAKRRVDFGGLRLA